MATASKKAISLIEAAINLHERADVKTLARSTAQTEAVALDAIHALADEGKCLITREPRRELRMGRFATISYLIAVKKEKTNDSTRNN